MDVRSLRMAVAALADECPGLTPDKLEKALAAASDAPELPEVMTLQEAAAKLRVHVKTIHEWIRSGRLHKIKLGRNSSRVTRESVVGILTEVVKQ